MIEFVKNDRLGIFQPERRKASQPRTQERRGTESLRTTSKQYDFLRDCLVRREAMQAKVGDRGRRVRHLLVATAIFFITAYFAAPDFHISLNAIGITQDLTLLQLSAVAPLIIAYLVLYACHLGATRLRLIHECKVIELELERFGSHTSYSLLREYRKECLANRGLWQDLVSTKSFFAIYSLYDIFLSASVVLALVGSTVTAVETYGQVAGRAPHAAVGFYSYLGIALLASVLGPVALRYSRRRKDAFVDEYIRKRLPEY